MNWALFCLRCRRETIQPGDLCAAEVDLIIILWRIERRNLGSVPERTVILLLQPDKDNDRIMVIGGNVRAWVRLKLLPGDYSQDGKNDSCPVRWSSCLCSLKIAQIAIQNECLKKICYYWQTICKEEIDIKGTTLEASVHALTKNLDKMVRLESCPNCYFRHIWSRYYEKNYCQERLMVFVNYSYCHICWMGH